MSQPTVAEVYRNARAFDLQGFETSAINTEIGDILTPEELAGRLKVDVGWIYEKRRPRCKNPIPAIPMGKIIRFDSGQDRGVAESPSRGRREIDCTPQKTAN